MKMMIVLVFALSISVAFSVFVLGFLIGYRFEDKKILLNKRYAEVQKTEESEREKKAKKEWKNFLVYDGSAPHDKI